MSPLRSLSGWQSSQLAPKVSNPLPPPGVAATHSWLLSASPDGISIGLPPGWHVEDAASNLERTRAGEAVLDLAQIPADEVGFCSPPRRLGTSMVASVILSVQKRPSASQADVAALRGARLAQCKGLPIPAFLSSSRLTGSQICLVERRRALPTGAE